MSAVVVRATTRYWWDIAKLVQPPASGGTPRSWLPRVLDAAITEIMAAAPDAPVGRLLWQGFPSGTLEGQVTCDADDGPAGDIAEAWGAYLGLAVAAAPGVGTVEYSGRVGGRRVVVWAVTDRAAFDREHGVEAEDRDG